MNKSNFSVSKIAPIPDFSKIKKNLIIVSWILIILGIILLHLGTVYEQIINITEKLNNANNVSEVIDYSSLTGKSFSDVNLKLPFEPYYLVAGGDVMLSRNIGYFAKNEGHDRIFKTGNYNPLSEFKDCTSNNCQLFLNLEGLFSEPDNDIQMGGFDFRSNPKNIETLQQFRENKPLLLALPNNHFINGGFQGLTITKELLNQNGIHFVGAGFSQEESRDFSTRTGNGMKFCLGAYSYDGTKANVRGGTVFWNKLNENEIKEDLEKMQNSDCDIKIISLHRGAEYKFSPNKNQKQIAHNLIDSGADLILGAHSHIPGEFEEYNGKYVFYSLGNFIFDQGRGKRATGSEFDYFYDTDLRRKAVPTYISMLIGLKFKKSLNGNIDIILDQINFSATTNGIFNQISKETTNNLLDRINLTSHKF